SISGGRKGNSRALSARSIFDPWNMPQSTSTFTLPVSNKKQEPVTPCAAPWKVKVNVTARLASSRGARDRGGHLQAFVKAAAERTARLVRRGHPGLVVRP